MSIADEINAMLLDRAERAERSLEDCIRTIKEAREVLRAGETENVIAAAKRAIDAAGAVREQRDAATRRLDTAHKEHVRVVEGLKKELAIARESEKNPNPYALYNRWKAGEFGPDHEPLASIARLSARIDALEARRNHLPGESGA